MITILAIGAVWVAAISVIGNWRVAVALEQQMAIQVQACAGCPTCSAKMKALDATQGR